MHRARALAATIVVLMLVAPTVRAADAPTSALSPAGEGRRLWLKLNCYSCHGSHAAGAIGPTVQGLGFKVRRAVTGGGTGLGMPNFSSLLTDTDITNLAAYLNVAGTAAEPTFLQWWKANPAN